MKKSVFLLIIVTLLAATLPAVVSAGTELDPDRFKLIAGQTEWVGLVEVWNDGEFLHVRYVTKWGLGFCLNETHLHVAGSLDGIPHTRKGNPRPGRFLYKDDDLGCVHDIEYVIPLGDSEPGDKLYIAAHAVVGNRCDPCYDETAWGVLCGHVDDWQFPGRNWATYILYTVQEPVPE